MSGKRRREPEAEEAPVHDQSTENRKKLLTGTSWWLYRAAPFHGFDSTALASYANELAQLLALSHATAQSLPPTTLGLRQNFVAFSVYRSNSSTPALRLILSPCGATNTTDKDFAFFPLVLARGPASMRKIAEKWAERRFDAVLKPAWLSPHQLGTLFAQLPPVEDGSAPLELLFQCSSHVKGIRNIAVALAATESRMLAEHTANDASFTSALTAHVLSASSVRLSALALVRVATPTFIVATEGRLKLLANADIERVLALVGEMCTP